MRRKEKYKNSYKKGRIKDLKPNKKIYLHKTKKKDEKLKNSKSIIKNGGNVLKT